MTRATSDHEACHLIAAAAAVTAQHGSEALTEFGVLAHINGGEGGFGVQHLDPDLCGPIHELCALGPVVLRLETPADLTKALRDSDEYLDGLTEAGDLSSNDRILARKVTDQMRQTRVLLAAQHLVHKRLGARGFAVLSKALRDAVNQNVASGELTLSDFVPPRAADGADAHARSLHDVD